MSKPKFMRCRTLALLSFLHILLTACANSTEYVAPQLPEPPADLTACSDADVETLPGAAGTGWTLEQVAGIIGEQRSAALAKDRCSRSWASFYDDLRKNIGGAQSH